MVKIQIKTQYNQIAAKCIVLVFILPCRQATWRPCQLLIPIRVVFQPPWQGHVGGFLGEEKIMEAAKNACRYISMGKIRKEDMAGTPVLFEPLDFIDVKRCEEWPYLGYMLYLSIDYIDK